jgi:hypothetical protein
MLISAAAAAARAVSHIKKHVDEREHVISINKPMS